MDRRASSLRATSAIVLQSMLACGACAGASPGASSAPPTATDTSAHYPGKIALPGSRCIEFVAPRPFDPTHPERSAGFWDLPWPGELRRAPNGLVALDDFPGRGSPLLSAAIAEASRELRGFSVAPVIFVRFDGPIDPSELPTVAESLSSSPVALIDVDPSSPERGRRWPLEPILEPIAGLGFTAVVPSKRVVGNAAAGAATLGWLRLAPEPGRDGHFVLYHEQAGPRLLRQVLSAVASGAMPPAIGPVVVAASTSQPAD